MALPSLVHPLFALKQTNQLSQELTVAFYIRYHSQARIQACKGSVLWVSFNLGITVVTIMSIVGHVELGLGVELART